MHRWSSNWPSPTLFSTLSCPPRKVWRRFSLPKLQAYCDLWKAPRRWSSRKFRNAIVIEQLYIYTHIVMRLLRYLIRLRFITRFYICIHLLCLIAIGIDFFICGDYTANTTGVCTRFMWVFFCGGDQC